ncbi:putative cytochrome P450 [Leucosporidium creatinivorum]|uniref:Putative cytochrome P450 n=1 Tax=Leucosporidium creatinivorum TaxID=106004 RepID=A0A1Y2F5T3_9BASI|nr:putative cytochrome P450 [Leucosporidium creatinivorum]
MALWEWMGTSELPSLLLRSLITLTLLACTTALLALYLRPRYSSLRFLRGPVSTSYLTGCWEEALAEEPGVAYSRWAEEYGGAVRVASFLGEDRLMLADSAGVNHVMKECYSYPKPPEVRGPLGRILGKGLQHAEGDDHRRQKRIMAPAFSTAHLRDLTPTFFAVAHKLRDHWLDLIAAGGIEEGAFKDSVTATAFEKKEGETVVDAMKWLSRAALDIIGLAGFDHPFNALSSSSDALGAAFSTMLSSTFRPTARIMLAANLAGKLISALPFDLSAWMPVEQVRRIRRCFETMESETERILQGKKEEARSAGGVGLGLGMEEEKRDLMTLMLKSNLEDVKMTMSDGELSGQMTTFVLAGAETTAGALAWALKTLAEKPHVEKQLRTELRKAKGGVVEKDDELEYDELDRLPLLDAFCREILRLHPSLPYTLREATSDDSIPLSTPVTSQAGQQLTAVPIKSGTVVMIPIYAMNRSRKVYGEDADEFRMERWTEEGVGKGAAGAWGQQITFWGGPRACIGYKFALLEMKVILTVLLDSFSFAPRDATIKLGHRAGAITRPIVVGEEALGCRMPLRVRRVEEG